MTRREHFRWLQEARRLLAESMGHELGPVKVIVAYEWSGHGVEFRLAAASGDDWPEEIVSTTAQADPRLRTPHRRVLAVMSTRPLTAKQIAGMADLNASYVREALADLVDWGHALHARGRYRLPERLPA